MKKRHNKQKNTTSEIALRKWCVEQAVGLASIPSETATGECFRPNTAIIRKGQIVDQAKELYDWVTISPQGQF